VNTKDSPTKQVRYDAILGGLSIGQFPLVDQVTEVEKDKLGHLYIVFVFGCNQL